MFCTHPHLSPDSPLPAVRYVDRSYWTYRRVCPISFFNFQAQHLYHSGISCPLKGKGAGAADGYLVVGAIFRLTRPCVLGLRTQVVVVCSSFGPPMSYFCPLTLASHVSVCCLLRALQNKPAPSSSRSRLEGARASCGVLLGSCTCLLVAFGLPRPAVLCDPTLEWAGEGARRFLLRTLP